jgi:hypothetical protein
VPDAGIVEDEGTCPDPRLATPIAVFHQASGAWKTENGDGHLKWWLSEPIEFLAVTEDHLFEGSRRRER